MYKLLMDALGASDPTPTNNPTREEILTAEIEKLEERYERFGSELKTAVEARDEAQAKRFGAIFIRTLRALSRKREELEEIKAKRIQRDAATFDEIDRLARVHGLSKVVSPAEACARYERVADQTN